nr:hypothetical protein [Tanacetum cinerariifolium]
MMAASKVLMLKPGEYEIWRMRIEQYIQMIDYALNKADLDTMSMDDLYNNLKVYEPEVKGMSSSSSNTQNMVVSSSNNNTSSTNGVVNISQAVNTTHEKGSLLLMAMKLLVLISLKWSSTTATRGDILLRSAKLQEIKTTSTKRSVLVETSTSLALVSCDGLGGYDWSDQAEEGPNYVLMAFLSSSSDSEASNDSTCSKSCLKTVKLLKSQNDQLLKDLKKSKLMVLDKFVNKHVVKNCKAKSSKEEPKVVRKNDDALLIEEWVSHNEEEDVSQPKIEKKIVRPSIAKIDNAFRVFNSKTRIVEENLHIRFSESTPNVVGSGLDWLFDIDALKRTMNYEPIVAGTQPNDFAGIDDMVSVLILGVMLQDWRILEQIGFENFGREKCYCGVEFGCRVKKHIESSRRGSIEDFVSFREMITSQLLYLRGNPKSPNDDGSKPSSDNGKKVDEDPRKENEFNDQEKEDNVNSTNNVNTVGTNRVNAVGKNISIKPQFDPNMPALEDFSTFDFSRDDDAVAHMNNLDTTIQNPPYKLTWADKEVPIYEGSSVTTTERYMETYKNVSQDIRDQLNAEAKAVQIILTGIDNDIYSTVDACPNACEMWKAIERLKHGESINIQDLETNLFWEFGKFTSQDGESLESYYSRFYKMMNELIRNQCDVTNHQVNVQAERIARVANPLALVAQQQPVYHPQHHPTHYNQNSSTRSQQAATRNRGKAIVNSHTPIYDQEPSMVAEDNEMSKDKEIDKLIALISLSFKKIYKPTNNNLRTSSNTSRANHDNSPWINIGTGYDNQRKCQRPKRAKDADHREKMLLSHYMYMAKLQEVTLDAADNSRPIFDTEPVQQKGEIKDFKTKNKSLESSNNRFKEANNELSKTNELLYNDFKKSQAELKRRNSMEYASKVEIDCAKAKEMKKELSAHQETISILSQQKEAQIKLYKTCEDKELDKVITLENKVK